MAIAPTGNIFKALSFDNVSSRTYGVYITGEAVYNAPERDVEMVEIPGRNGSFALDKGRFQNIEVSYPAGIFADSEADFAEAVSDFRNFLCSRNGYVRLTDEYNPNEYRMAIYKSGLEVTPAQLKAGEFNIVFDCKPQRWLTSGEEAITVADGDTLTNPTLFDSSPLLEVKGNGTIGFNGYEIDVANAELGEIYLAIEKTAIPNPTAYSDFSNTLLNNGDDIYVDGITVYAWTAQAYALSATNSNANFSTTFRKDTSVDYDKYIVATKVKPFTAKLGTAYEASDTVTIQGLQSLSSGTFTATINIVVRVNTYYSPSDRSFCSVTPTVTTTSSGDGACYKDDVTFGTIRGYSTQPIPADPAYIDCDIGEAYAIDGGTVVSLNRIIDLGSDLPKLASGPNEITYDNTITELKIHPRWWKV